MNPSYAQIFSEYDRAEERIQLATVQYSDSIKAKLQTLTTECKFATQGCRPLFLCLRNGGCVGVVDGLNTPNVASLIKLWIPPLKKVEEE